jgi:methylase of polypeptide subunit release factors
MNCSWKRALGALTMTTALAAPALAQEGVGDVVYVPTPQVVVDEMLSMAKAGPRDFVIDLGSGDGRMVITAAKKFGARGFGVDLDPVLLKRSNDTARAEGVADRARFVDQNLFETDLSQATVITTYLLPEMNARLRPKILALRPGTRVVAHDYHMGDWIADEERTLQVPEKKVGNPGVSYIYLWIVPARVAGRWASELVTAAGAQKVEFSFDQRYQMLDGVARTGGQELKLRAPKIDGERVSFSLLGKVRQDFSGAVKGDAIEGTVRTGEGAGAVTTPWTAKLVARGPLQHETPPSGKGR